ncbi:MAG: DUF2628 domain-containing protein [Nitrosomonadaceae bacterium]
MNKYNAYKHPVYGWMVVKQGFSWPGFFFTWIWAFVKKLWMDGIFLLLIIIIFNTVVFAIIQSASMKDDAGNLIGVLIVYALLITPHLITGFFGNSWRRKSYSKRGFAAHAPVDARSADDALAKVNNQD